MSNRRFALINKALSGASAEVNDLSTAVTWANVPDANITESSVTQHEAAMTILESQITDGTLLARRQEDETITGQWTFQGTATLFNNPIFLRGSNALSIFDTLNTSSATIDNNTATLSFSVAGSTANFAFTAQDGISVYDAAGTDRIRIRDTGAVGVIDTNTNVIQIIPGGSYAAVTIGKQWRVYDATNADYKSDSHDGTDFNSDFVNTTDWNLNDGIRLKLWDSSGVDNFYMTDTGTEAQFVANNNSFNWYSQFASSGARTMRLTEDTLDVLANVIVNTGHGLFVEGPGSTNRIAIIHDDTDLNFTHVGTTDWNITGITSINAGTVDADFDAITATSYGGITEANLTDKLFAENISGNWHFAGTGAGSSVQFQGNGKILEGSDLSGATFNLRANQFNFLELSVIDNGTANEFAILKSEGNTTVHYASNVAMMTLTTNTLAAPTVNADFAAITGTSYGGILEANLVDKTVAEVFTGNSLEVSGASARFILAETGVTADEGDWEFLASGEVFQFGTINDARNSRDPAFTIDRTGVTIGAITFHGGRSELTGSGVYNWGSAAAHGSLTWDTGKAIVASLGSNDLVLDSNSGIIMIQDGGTLRIADTDESAYLDFSHDGTDFDIVGTNTTNLGIAGITQIQAGTVDADFDAISATYFQPQSLTSTSILDITHDVNTNAGKIPGAMIFNTTTGLPLWAAGNTDGAVWLDATGATAHTPV